LEDLEVIERPTEILILRMSFEDIILLKDKEEMWVHMHVYSHVTETFILNSTVFSDMTL
jgi:hypothetical protein